MEIEWQDNHTILKARADRENGEQHVILEVESKNDRGVPRDGYTP